MSKSSSLREITDNLTRPLKEKEIWTLLYLSVESLLASYKDFKSNNEIGQAVGPFLIISVDCLLLYKGQVQFSSGLQNEAAAENSAPELLADSQSIDSLEKLQKTHIYSLGNVLMSVMNTDTCPYSKDLTSLLYGMCNKDQTLRPMLKTILQMSQKGMEVNDDEDSILESDDSESSNIGEPNLAAEIAAANRANVGNLQREHSLSGSSSLSSGSQGSFDTMNHPTNSSSKYKWSSQEKLKAREQEKEKSQYYTPVREHRPPGLPSCPPPNNGHLNKREMETFNDMPTLPPPAAIDDNKILPTQRPTSDGGLLTSTPKMATLPVVTTIENILEVNKAPDLLKGGAVDLKLPPDLFKVPNDVTTESSTLPTPPHSLPPQILPEMSRVDSHEHSHHIEGSIAETSLDSPDNVTFDYTNVNGATASQAVVSTDEFDITFLNKNEDNKKPDSFAKPGLVLPFVTDNENKISSLIPLTEIHSNNNEGNAKEGATYDDSPLVDSKLLVRDEFNYTIPFKKVKKVQTKTVSQSTDDIVIQSEDTNTAAAADSNTRPSNTDIIDINSIDPTYESINIEVLPQEEPKPSQTRRVSIVLPANQSQKVERVLGRSDESSSHVTRRKVSHSFFLESHTVAVKSLFSKTFHVRINPKATCQNLKEQVLNRLNINEPDTYGLAVLINNEYIFLEPNCEVYKYAPSGWKSWKAGSRRISERFVVHFRVMFSPTNIGILKEEQTRNHHFIQAFDDVLNGRITVTMEEALCLAGLALQANFGYQRQTSRDYFKPSDYLPDYIIQEMADKNDKDENDGKDVRHALWCAHEQRMNLTKERAEYYYLLVSKLNGYGYIFYTVSKTKKNSPFSKENLRLLGFSPAGLEVCYKENHKLKRDLFCPWRATERIEFKDCKIILEVLGKPPLILYSQSYKRSHYYVKLSERYHYFDRKYRSLSDSEENAEETLYNVFDYSGQFKKVRLTKDVMKGLGISIRSHVAPSQTFAEIEAVKESGPASNEGTLRVGDLLIAINRISMINKPHHEVGKILKRCPPLVDLVIFRCDGFIGEQNEVFNIINETSGNEELSFNHIDEPEMLTKITESSFVEDIDSKVVSSNDIKTVTLKKEDGSFGFSISANKKNPYHIVTITRITPNGPADKSGIIKVSDQIVSIGGQCVEGKQYHEVFKMLTEADEEMTLQLRPPGDGCFVTVILAPKNEPLGLQIKEFEGSILVSYVAPNSQSDRAGIKVGDEIIEVNGEILPGLSQREASDVLLRNKQQVSLYLKKQNPSLSTAADDSFCSLSTSFSRYTPDDEHVIFLLSLTKGSKGFGFKIRKDLNEADHGLFVASVDYDPALSDGRLKSGDEILEVNGQSLVSIQHRVGIQIMKAVVGEGTMVVRRKKALHAGSNEEVDSTTGNGVEELMLQKKETVNEVSIVDDKLLEKDKVNNSEIKLNHIQLVTIEPVANEPVVAIEPVTIEPVAIEPVAIEQVVAIEPVTIEPVAIEPVAIEQVVAIEPVTIEPVAIEPVAIEPVTIEPVVIEPVTIEPVAIELTTVPTTKSIATELVATEPVAIEPVATEPVTIEIEPTTIPTTKPIATEPVTTEPVAIESVIIEIDVPTTKPVAIEPVATEPVSEAVVEEFDEDSPPPPLPTSPPPLASYRHSFIENETVDIILQAKLD